MTTWRMKKDLPGCPAGTIGEESESGLSVEFKNNYAKTFNYWVAEMKNYSDFFERVEEDKPSAPRRTESPFDGYKIFENLYLKKPKRIAIYCSHINLNTDLPCELCGGHQKDKVEIGWFEMP